MRVLAELLFISEQNTHTSCTLQGVLEMLIIFIAVISSCDLLMRDYFARLSQVISVCF